MDFKELRKRLRQQGGPAPRPQPAPASPAEDEDDEPELFLATTVGVPDAGEPEEAPAAVEPDDDAGEDEGELWEEDEPLELREIMRFRLNREFFALFLDEIEEIIKPRGLTRVPRSPGWVLGILSLRGTMIPVVDLCRRLGIGDGQDTSRRIIVVNHQEDACGLVVDEVRNVERIDPGKVEPVPAALSGPTARFLSGLVRVNGELIALLDLQAILDVEGERDERAA